MRSISTEDVLARVRRDNPWWTAESPEVQEWSYPRRTYFEPFAKLALNPGVRRAVVLLGPRRVGKTVMIKQLVQEAIEQGYDGANILYASIDTPVYFGLRLDQLVSHISGRSGPKLVIFDEIQYLKDWEIGLKDLVDSYADVKFIATGSAAAALRLKSRESGAGRFSEFMLPPLTFHEFLCFQNLDEDLIDVIGARSYREKDIERLNHAFIDYLNYGGYPEAVLNKDIRDNPDQFIRNDIIDKVLLKDLPALYGIDNIPELNRLFSFLAYNAGDEASLENISRESGLAKPTIKRYIEYLESAFLIIKVQMVGQDCRSMQRERTFKIYLNNPSMRAALFSPVDKDDPDLIGKLAESAIFSQWQHMQGWARNLRYARWKNEGEVDIVYLDSHRQKPIWAVEVKWSDRIIKDERVLKSLRALVRANPMIEDVSLTSRTHRGAGKIEDVDLEILPTAALCYSVGRNTSSHALDRQSLPLEMDDDADDAAQFDMNL